MRAYVARQPIFDKNRFVYGYELLYRDNNISNAYHANDGNKATQKVISDVITTFGLDSLTNGKYAFINFTRPLLMSSFPLLLDPDDFVIEILEDVEVDDALIERVRELKGKGYILAIDDFIGDGRFSGLFPYVDIIKVDFSLINRHEQEQLARVLSATGKRLLAEKVETEEMYTYAVKCGYTLFQGYFFSRPAVFSKSLADIASSTCMRLMHELSRPSPDFEVLANIIRVDVNMTYRFLRRINTLEYYRSHRVRSIKHALVRMGLREIRRWITLVMLRDSCTPRVSEMMRTALIRGVFAEKIADEIGIGDYSDDAFTTGMFSVIDAVMEDSLPDILADVCISENAKEALLGHDNILRDILNFVKAYEQGDWETATDSFKTYPIQIDKAGDFYLEAVSYADLAFDESLAPGNARF